MTADRSRVAVRADLADVAPYGAPQLDVPVRLNTNETPEPPPPAFLDALAARVRDLPLHRYPDRPATELRAALGRRFDLPAARVWAANGSNEVLLQLFQAYGGPGRRLLLTDPGYSAHPLIARAAVTDVVRVDLDADFRLDPATAAAAVERHDPAIVCVASPHNPAGRLVGPDTVRALHDAGGALVVVDEAYIEFAAGDASAAALLDELDRLVVTRTFSKAWRLAGLRLGYLLGPAWVVDDVRRVRLPYHLDALTQQAGLVALACADAMTAHVGRIVAERRWLVDRLREIDRVEPLPSDANFVLVRAATDGLFARLLDHGVLVRDFSTVRGLEGCVRITVGTRDEHERLLAAIAAVVGRPAS